MKSVRIEDICQRITSGGTPSRKRDDYYDVKPGGHLWVKSKELLDTSISETEEHISDLGLKGSSAKYLDARTVLVAMYGANVGQLGWLRKPATVNQAICGITTDPAKADYRWLFYALMHHRYRLIAMAQGAAQQNISDQLIKAFELTVPPLPTQRRISSILSTYDDLIENNTRRIAILEEMARRLYEEWFVHFRFPGHEKVEFDGELPTGWQPSTVKESVERFTTGKKFDQKTVKTAGSVPVFDQGKTGIIGYHDEEPGFQASWDDPVIVFANHTCYQRLVMFPFSSIQNVIPFKSSTQFPRNIYWLHHATVGLVELNDYKGHWPQFAAKEISIPPAELTDEFGSKVAPLHKQVRLLQQKNANLRAQRDLLLPKLVSGEIDVSVAEAALEAAE